VPGQQLPIILTSPAIVPFMRGPLGRTEVAANWLTSAGPITTDVRRTGWNGYTVVQVIAAAQLANNGGTQVRVTFRAGNSTEGLKLASAYIGPSAMAGDAYDAASLTQLLFGGSASTTIAASADKVSDAVNFVLDTSKDLIVAFHCDDATNDEFMSRNAAQTGWTGYYSNSFGNQSGTANKTTGYNLSSDPANCVVLVETLH
jgi:hypothetical protein